MIGTVNRAGPVFQEPAAGSTQAPARRVAAACPGFHEPPAQEDHDLPRLMGRTAEDLDWQRVGIQAFFQDDSAEDDAYNSL